MTAEYSSRTGLASPPRDDKETSQRSLPSESAPILLPTPVPLFIGGAPRSGTTLLANLLDGHPEILQFPVEHGTLENWFRRPAPPSTYFKDRFLADLSEGQQAMLANDNVRRRKAVAFEREFGREMDLPETDAEKFRRGYVARLRLPDLGLSDLVDALMHGLVCASGQARAHLEAGDVRYFSLKQPFYTELFAIRTAEAIETARFIQVIRDGRSRYLSARARGLRRSRFGRRTLSPMSGAGFTTGTAALGQASLALAEQNRRALGPDRYLILRFEDLVRDPTRSVAEVIDFLGLEAADFQVKPTRLGSLANSQSVLGRGGDIDSSAADRSSRFASTTRWNERAMYAASLDAGGDGDRANLKTLCAFTLPIEGTSLRNHVRQLHDGMRLLRRSQRTPVERTIDLALRGRIRTL